MLAPDHHCFRNMLCANKQKHALTNPAAVTAHASRNVESTSDCGDLNAQSKCVSCIAHHPL